MSNATGDMRAVLNACVAALDELVAEASGPVTTVPVDDTCSARAANDGSFAAPMPSVPREQGARALSFTALS